MDENEVPEIARLKAKFRGHVKLITDAQDQLHTDAVKKREPSRR